MKKNKGIILACFAVAAVGFWHASAASIDLRIDLPEGLESPDKEVRVNLFYQGKGSTANKNLVAESTSLPFGKLFEDVAAGKYVATVDVSNRSDSHYSEAGDYRSFLYFSVPSEESKEVRFTYEPLDTGDFLGDKSFKGTLFTFDGAPAPRTTFDVVALEGQYQVLISTVTTDGQGIFEVLGISEEREYELFQKHERLGRIERNAGSVGEIRIRPRVGDYAPNVAFKKLSSLEDVALAGFSGKVVVLEFWSTSCGPCQEPMNRMNTYRQKYPDWGDDVELIAVSLDRSQGSLEKHIESRKWHDLYHGWAGKDSFRSEIADVYGVYAIPDCLVIDRDGKIVERTHPGHLDLPKIIESLL